METILHQVAKGLFDRATVRAMLGHMGLFPVGSLLEIDGSNYAKVVQAHPDAYTRPVVRVFAQAQRLLDAPETIDLAARSEVMIRRAIDPRKLPVALPDDFLMAAF